ncbi:MAG: autotransporter outer membrane beta-barrel domain-containing protein [Gammaproteobacteria bacterium]|nr:autotransporter outer membrane beta-barrel domain-containing protein [Gammaproteobacteria bacterium]
MLNSIGVAGVVNSVGFNAGSTIGLTLTFGDGTNAETALSNSGTMGATLVLENAERIARYISTTNGVVTFSYGVVAGDNGSFGLKLTGVDALADLNGNPGLATGWESTVAEKLAGRPASERRVDTRGPQVTKIRITNPESGSTVNGVSTGSPRTDQITFVVTFDESLPVSSETVGARGVSLRVNIGSTPTSASCPNPTSAGETLTCMITVAEGWLGALSTPANPLNYAFIRDDLGNDATPAFAAQRFPDVNVDAVRPTITSATIRIPKVEEGSNIVVQVTFSEDVEVTGAPTATISITPPGTTAPSANSAVYASVTGRVVEFRHPIVAANFGDRNGGTTATVKLTSVDLDGVTDEAANPPPDDDFGATTGINPKVDETAAYKTGTRVNLKAIPENGSSGDQYADATAPTLDRISLGGTVKSIYGLADTITFDVLFSEEVTVTDSDSDVSLAVRIGSSDVSVSDESTLALSTTAAVRQTVTIPLAGKSYNGTVSVSGIALPDDGDRVLDGSDTTGSGSSDTAPPACSAATQRGTTTTYDYTCEGRGWINDPDHPSVSGRSRTTKITKSLTGSATVDTTRPAIASVTLLPAPAPSATGRDGQRYYGEDDIIRIQVTMSEDVTVNENSAPKLGLDITDSNAGTANAYASFEALSGKRNLIFEYRVQAGDTDRNGIQVTSLLKNDESTALDPSEHNDAAIIKDIAGNGCDADCGFRTWASTQSGRHRVDGSISGDQAVAPILEGDSEQTPSVSPVRAPVVRSSPVSGDYYRRGETIRIDVPLSPAVTFTSRPQLLLSFEEGGDRRVNAEGSFSSTGTVRTNLVFNYDVVSGDQDANGITGTLQGGGTVSVEDGSRVNFNGVTINLPSSVRVDALAPELEPPLTITPKTGGVYVAGETIEVTASFSEPVRRVTLADEPELTILIGGEERTATLQSPAATVLDDEYVFRYTVAAGDNGDVTIAADALEASLEDAAGNPADVDHPLVAASTAQTVDTKAPSVASISLGDAKTYLEGDTITATVTFDEAVDVNTGTGAAELQLTIGSATETAAYASGDNSDTLTFTYTVKAGDNGAVSIAANALMGRIEDAGGNDAGNNAAMSFPGHEVDAQAPSVERVFISSVPANAGTYTFGEDIVFSVQFTEPVTVAADAESTLRLYFQMGDLRRKAYYESGDRTDTLRFSYSVRGEEDTDGVSVLADQLTGSEVQDLNGLVASLSHAALPADAAHKVDGIAAMVTGAVIASDPGDDDTYITGDAIQVAVLFGEPVTVTGAPRLALQIGDMERNASFAGGSGGPSLLFSYTVQSGDFDDDGISANANALSLNGGSIQDANGLNVSVEHPAVPAQKGHLVDAIAAVIVGAAPVSDAGDDDTYIVGDTIQVAVMFSKAVNVEGAPTLMLSIGDDRPAAALTGGSGSDTLTFNYMVQMGDLDEDGISALANSLALNGGMIADANGLAAMVAHPAVPAQAAHMVDGVAPMVSGAMISSSPASGDAYDQGETIEVTVTFDEDVRVEGSPMLPLVIGANMRDAMCAQGMDDMAALMCSYVVAQSDFDADGVSVEANALNGGMITDVPGNAASVAHPALADDPGHKVFAARPVVQGRIVDVRMVAGGFTWDLDIAGLFGGFEPTLAASSSDTSVVRASVTGTMLMVTSDREGTAQVTVTATNPAGSAEVSFTVEVGTDQVEKAVLNDALAGIGRAMLSSTANVIGSRFNLTAGGGGTMTFAGQRFSPQAYEGDLMALWQNDGFGGRNGWAGQGFDDRYSMNSALTTERMFSGTAFNMPLNAVGAGDMAFAVWGAGDLQSFEGEPDQGNYDGSSSAGFLGVDARGDGWLAGVSVSRMGSEADYGFSGAVDGGGTLETSVTSFHPYAKIDVSEDMDVWVVGGFGSGEADLSRMHVSGDSESSDLSMTLAVGGLRRALAMQFGGADLALRGDAGFLSLETDSGIQAVDGLSASVSRLRLGLEAAWEGESATPFVEVSGRFDGGDGQTGGGIELAGGLRIANAESGFGLEAKGRVLAMHSGEGYSESGFTVAASFEPGAAGRGITLRLAPRWGGSADSSDLFWDEHRDVQDVARFGFQDRQTWGMDAALGYGFGLKSLPGLVTPFSQFDVTGNEDQRIRVGVRYGLMRGLLGGTQLELSAERVDGRFYQVGETRVLVSGQARF